MASLLSLGALVGAGGVAVSSAIFSLFIRKTLRGKAIFLQGRPSWLAWLVWAYLTFAILAWIAFFEIKTAGNLLILGILTLMAVKFLLLFIIYFQWKSFYIWAWDQPVFSAIIFGSVLILGSAMISTALWLQ